MAAASARSSVASCASGSSSDRAVRVLVGVLGRVGAGLGSRAGVRGLRLALVLGGRRSPPWRPAGSPPRPPRAACPRRRPPRRPARPRSPPRPRRRPAAGRRWRRRARGGRPRRCRTYRTPRRCRTLRASRRCRPRRGSPGRRPQPRPRPRFPPPTPPPCRTPPPSRGPTAPGSPYRRPHGTRRTPTASRPPVPPPAADHASRSPRSWLREPDPRSPTSVLPTTRAASNCRGTSPATDASSMRRTSCVRYRTRTETMYQCPVYGWNPRGRRERHTYWFHCEPVTHPRQTNVRGVTLSFIHAGRHGWAGAAEHFRRSFCCWRWTRPRVPPHSRSRSTSVWPSTAGGAGAGRTDSPRRGSYRRGGTTADREIQHWTARWSCCEGVALPYGRSTGLAGPAWGCARPTSRIWSDAAWCMPWRARCAGAADDSLSGDGHGDQQGDRGPAGLGDPHRRTAGPATRGARRAGPRGRSRQAPLPGQRRTLVTVPPAGPHQARPHGRTGGARGDGRPERRGGPATPCPRPRPAARPPDREPRPAPEPARGVPAQPRTDPWRVRWPTEPHPPQQRTAATRAVPHRRTAESPRPGHGSRRSARGGGTDRTSGTPGRRHRSRRPARPCAGGAPNWRVRGAYRPFPSGRKHLGGSLLSSRYAKWQV